MWVGSKDQFQMQTREWCWTENQLYVDHSSTYLRCPQHTSGCSTHKGSFIIWFTDSLSIWKSINKKYQQKLLLFLITYIFQSHCLRERNLGVRFTLSSCFWGGGLFYSEVEEDLKPVTCLDLYNWIKIPGCYCGNHTLKIRSWQSQEI